MVSSQTLLWWFQDALLIHSGRSLISLKFSHKLQIWADSRCMQTYSNLHNSNNNNQIQWQCSNSRWQCFNNKWQQCRWVEIITIHKCNKCKLKCNLWCRWWIQWWCNSQVWPRQIRWIKHSSRINLWECNSLGCNSLGCNSLRWTRMPVLLKCSKITRQCPKRNQKIAWVIFLMLPKSHSSSNNSNRYQAILLVVSEAQASQASHPQTTLITIHLIFEWREKGVEGKFKEERGR